jgi:glycosyltransferase involved in cell wall biosynthesis/predicted metal-dependent phosphoesterase TrpH
MNRKFAKADLHVHTRHSTRAADWLLRKLDFPASMSDPATVHRQLRQAGMDFVTFTDHDTMAGCQEVAGLPGMIVGEEVTAVFPEDECKVHLLVWGHIKSQHQQIQALKDNIYELQKYLASECLTHAVAHPLHSPNEKLGALHMQKLVLLFRHFETVNGRYHSRLGEAVTFALTALTPRSIEEFVARTGLVPTHEEPWRKAFVGGSDDHGGMSLARAWTETPAASTPAEFLEHIREGRCKPGGTGGDPLVVAHGTYQTAFDFVKKKFALNPGSPGAGLMEKAFSRFMEGKDPTEFTLGEKLGFLAQGIATGKIFEMAMAGNTTLWKELSSYFSKPEVRASLARETQGVEEPERRTFLMANLMANQLGYRLFTQFIGQISTGKLIDSIQTISPVAPLVGLLSPYIHALRMPRRDTLRDVVKTLSGKVPDSLKNRKRAWFTDTLEDVNGVATTIRKMVAAGVAGGHDIRVFTCRSKSQDLGIPIENFAPVGEFELPEYELQSLSFPPVLHILDHLVRNNYSEVIISTPGPIGLVALYAAKALGIRSIGIYHTDFPQYVRILTDDSFMETLTWDYMHWFYSQLDLVYVNSEDYMKSWVSRGIGPEKLKILPRGLDSGLFNPSRRDPNFWKSRGLREGELGMLYVGRVSKEKNLDTFVAVTRRLAEKQIPARPIIVGDGPYMSEMKRLLPDAIFTGYLRGQDLATGYASADFFLFPSTTDTFGNVILEAQACGLPAIVSDVGGPRDLIRHGTDGFITKALDVSELTQAVEALAKDAQLRQSMSTAARARVQSRDWGKAFEAFWNASSE